jgi:RHS repeat-associated protein
MLREAYKPAIVLILLLVSSVAYAGYDDQESPTDLFCEPGKTAGNNPAFGGKPISLFSGMETFAPSTDLTLGNLFPIQITRSYNSKTTYDSPLGYGWGINYDKRLYMYADNSITVRRNCGAKSRFTWSGPGYISQSGDSGSLIPNADGSFTYVDMYGQIEAYNPQGRLSSMVDTKGNSLVFSYDSTSRDFLWGILPANADQSNPVIVAYDYHLSMIAEMDSFGNPTGASVSLQYDSSTGRLTSISDSTGRTVTYGHDAIGNLTSVTGLAGSSAYGYTDPTGNHLLTSIDEGQGPYVNTYDTTGRVIQQNHGTGEIDFAYTVPNQTTTMTTLIKDASGNLLNTQTRTVQFDTNGKPIQVTDTFGNVTTYVRDNNAWILQEGHTDIATGISTNIINTYDGVGNVLSRTEAAGTPQAKTTTYTYDPTFNLVTTETVSSVVQPNQTRVITRTYNETNGNLLTTTETGLLGNGTAYSYTTSYTYYSNGKIATITGPRTDVQSVTTYYYDPMTNNLNGVSQPVVGTTTYSNFDPLGNPQTVTDPNGNSTTYTYDSIGRVLTVQAPGDTGPTQYFYVSGGCLSCGGANKIDHIILPMGNTIYYVYDSFGNLASIKDSLSNSINYTYDSGGNKLSEQISDPSGALQKSLSYQYDALNRLSAVINPDSTSTSYGYDSRNNRISTISPKGNTSTYQYDVLNRLLSVTQPGTITTTYGYDTNNDLTSVTDANNNTTTYKYDDHGRVYQVISPDTGTTTYSYDPAGNLISKTDANGITISYQYDALNRLTQITFPDTTQNIAYIYDTCMNGKGRLCTMTDASGMTSYAYTAKGQILQETKVIDSNQYITQYAYDQNGNLRTMTYPSGRVITYNISNDKVINVLNNAANLATNISYKPFGGMSGITYGNGIAGTISYDNQYRITSMVAGAVLSLSYDQYDADANVQHITNTLDSTKNKTFGYDALDRVTSASGSWGSLVWTYDGVGNRLTENSNNYTYASNTNKLSSANGESFGFDNDGNTTLEGSRQYIYNQNQRLVQVNGSTSAYYTYNGNGQRVKKNVNGTVTVFHYNQSGQIIAESNSAGTTVTEYVYLNGQPLAMITNGNTYYYHTDHLATPHKMTDSSGAVVWSAYYKPFGAATVTVSTITNNLRFPGQYYDFETGLSYNYFRDYNPVIGRYVEADPLMDVMKVNNYRDRPELLSNFFRYYGISNSVQLDEIKSYVSGELIKTYKAQVVNKINLEKTASEILSEFTILRFPTILHPYSYSNQNSIRFNDPMGLMSCSEQCQWLCGAGWAVGGTVVCGIVGGSTIGVGAIGCGLGAFILGKQHCDTVCTTLCTCH